MTTIQTDVSAEALVTAIRANMCDFFRHLSKSNPAERFENEQFTRWYRPLPHLWFNGVLSSNPPLEDADLFIVETLGYFRGKGVQAFTWWMEPHLKPAEWEPALSKHGFGFSDNTPGMAVDLYELNDALQPTEGFEICSVDDAESLHTWVDIFLNGYGLPSAWESMTFDLWLQLGLDLPIRNYLGYLNGKPVSTSTVFYGGGTFIVWRRCPPHAAKALGRRSRSNHCRMHVKWAIASGSCNLRIWASTFTKSSASGIYVRSSTFICR